MKAFLRFFRFDLSLFGVLRLGQLEFDERLAGALEGMADWMEEKGPGTKEDREEAFKLVERAVLTCCADLPKETFAARLEAFFPLTRRIRTWGSSLDKEM